MYVGQPEYDAGFAAGLRAKGDGVTSFLCVNHAIQQPTVGERCQGFADGLGVDLGESMIDSRQDPAGNQEPVWPISTPTRHRRHPDPWPDLRRSDDRSRSRKTAWPATSISAPSTWARTSCRASRTASSNWGIDQQPFLQAYLPVVVLTNYHRYGVLPGNNINSGPGFVTADGTGNGGEVRGRIPLSGLISRGAPRSARPPLSSIPKTSGGVSRWLRPGKGRCPPRRRTNASRKSRAAQGADPPELGGIVGTIAVFVFFCSSPATAACSTRRAS
jgi:hypothetical protein